MNLELRAPYAEEWPLCRMLLPETFADAGAREYVLCLQEESPRLVGAMSFRRTGDIVTRLRMHVVPGARRRGVASRMVDALFAGGARVVEGISDSTTDAGAENFSEANGFRRIEQLFLVEGEVATMRGYLHRLRERIRVPKECRVVRLGEAPFAEVARLHAEEVAHSDLNPWRARLGQTKGLEDSVVVMAGDRVAGFLLWSISGDVATVYSRVIAPGFRGSWVLVAALSEALDRGWNAGARRVRFSYNDSNSDTERLAARFDADRLGVVTHYRRERREPEAVVA